MAAAAVGILLGDKEAGRATASFCTWRRWDIDRSLEPEAWPDLVTVDILLGCRGGVGSAFGGIPGDVRLCIVGEQGSPPGEKGGVCVKWSRDNRRVSGTARGVDCEE